MSTGKVALKILGTVVSVLIYILIIVVLLRLGAASYELGYRVFTEPPAADAPGRDVMIQVETNMTAIEIGTILEEKGLIRDAYLFAIQMRISAHSKNIKPGTHTLNTSQTAAEMLAIMSAEPGDEDEEKDETDPEI